MSKSIRVVLALWVRGSDCMFQALTARWYEASLQNVPRDVFLSLLLMYFWKLFLWSVSASERGCIRPSREIWRLMVVCRCLRRVEMGIERVAA